MRLSDWAKQNGVSYKTARRYFDAGKIAGAYRLSERIIVVPSDAELNETTTTPSVAIYARVSSHDQKDNLEHQAERLVDFAISQGFIVDSVVKEIASGMNPRRKKLINLLSDKNISTIIVENRDRLARINADLIIAASNKNFIIVNQSEPEHNDVQDVVDFLTSVYARQYGKRSAKNRAERHAKAVLND